MVQGWLFFFFFFLIKAESIGCFRWSKPADFAWSSNSSYPLPWGYRATVKQTESRRCRKEALPCSGRVEAIEAAVEFVSTWLASIYSALNSSHITREDPVQSDRLRIGSKGKGWDTTQQPDRDFVSSCLTAEPRLQPHGCICCCTFMSHRRVQPDYVLNHFAVFVSVNCIKYA